MRVDINANELDADIHLNIIKQQNTKMFIKIYENIPQAIFYADHRSQRCGVRGRGGVGLGWTTRVANCASRTFRSVVIF